MKRIILTITIAVLSLTAYSQKSFKYLSSECSYTEKKNDKWSEWSEWFQEYNVIIITEGNVKIHENGKERNYRIIKRLDWDVRNKSQESTSFHAIADNGNECVITMTHVMREDEIVLFIHRARMAKSYKLESF